MRINRFVLFCAVFLSLNAIEKGLVASERQASQDVNSQLAFHFGPDSGDQAAQEAFHFGPDSGDQAQDDNIDDSGGY